jgi:hypothetical protein
MALRAEAENNLTVAEFDVNLKPELKHDDPDHEVDLDPEPELETDAEHDQEPEPAEEQTRNPSQYYPTLVW